jgi:capsid protein
MMVDLAPGEKIETASATRPNTAFDAFVLSVLRQVAVGIEIPFEVLIKHFTASYSASRAALLDAYRFFFRERDQFVIDYCQPVWEWAINEAVARGLLEAPGFFDNPMIRDAWLGCDWVGDGMPQIDPLKEAKAAQEWNTLGIWSLQDISAQQNRDFDRTHRQLIREKKMRDDAGLTPVEAAPAALQQHRPSARWAGPLSSARAPCSPHWSASARAATGWPQQLLQRSARGKASSVPPSR